MFRFNAASPFAWNDAIARHRRGDGAALGLMLDSGALIPRDALAYVANVVRTAATRPRGRRAVRESLSLYTKRIYRDRAIAARVAGLRTSGAISYEAAVEAVAQEFRVSETTVCNVLRKPLPDE